MSTFNNQEELDLNILDASDYQILRIRIDQQARADGIDEFGYRYLLNDSNYQRAIAHNYIVAKKSLMMKQICDQDAKTTNTPSTEGNEICVPNTHVDIPIAVDTEKEPRKKKLVSSLNLRPSNLMLWMKDAFEITLSRITELLCLNSKQIFEILSEKVSRRTMMCRDKIYTKQRSGLWE
jgi:hypothetical protein